MATAITCAILGLASAAPVHGVTDDCDGARFLSFHIHVMFWQGHEDSTAGALQLRNEFIDHFELGGDGENNCTISAGDPAPNASMCVFEVDWEPAGPFVAAQYSFFIPRANYSESVEWMLHHRGIYDVLVHPNSGCETNDHTSWALWGGTAWPIDTSIFSCNSPGCVPQGKDTLRLYLR